MLTRVDSLEAKAPRAKPVGPPLKLAWRTMIAWRGLMALAGGYVLGALLTSAMARGLPVLGVSRLDATTWGVLGGLMLMPCVAIAAFGIKRTWLASAIIVGFGLILFAITRLAPL